MSLEHVAVIGYGSIAKDLISILRAQEKEAPKQVSILVRANRVKETLADLGDTKALVTSDLRQFMDAKPNIVAECAGHKAALEFGPPILRRGIDLVITSVGALADRELYSSLEAAADESGAQCVIPAGAIGGIDALAAAKLSGLNSVVYTGRKPPTAWAGSLAEDILDLKSLTEEIAFFTGTAREAALKFPKNANVAATLALAGLGMDNTQVRLIADPDITENVHEFEVKSEALEFRMQLMGKPSPSNPKTSRSTAFSIARAVLNQHAAIQI